MKPKKLLSALITVLALTLTGCNSGSSPATPSYTVTFNSNGGSAVESQTVKQNNKVTKPENPTKTGYTFYNWTYDGDEWSFTEDKVTGNMTLDANWNIRTYTISYLLDGGTSEGNPTTYTIETATFALKNAVKEGYTFTGWTDQNGDAVSTINKGSTGDLVLTANYSANQYTITFNTNGGSLVPSITLDYGAAVPTPETPTRTGYTFAGWDKAIPSTMPSHNMTINAKWSVNQYTITFDTDGGSYIAPITQDYGTEVTRPNDPTKAGYHFVSWDRTFPSTMPAENITLKAIWGTEQYTITFDTDGGSYIAPITQDYGTKINKPADPTKTGYTFLGWDKAIPDTMPNENMIIKATYLCPK